MLFYRALSFSLHKLQKIWLNTEISTKFCTVHYFHSVPIFILLIMTQYIICWEKYCGDTSNETYTRRLVKMGKIVYISATLSTKLNFLLICNNFPFYFSTHVLNISPLLICLLQAAALLIGFAKELAACQGACLGQAFPEMPIGDLPALSHLGSRTNGVRTAQACCHGCLKG